MALRVLLADESNTIKKVFQLALQDFAVEVQTVHVGIEVVNLALKFKPDIIFADVLLQKRICYEVAADLKRHSELGNLPVVLMWSGFMELDQDKYQASRADSCLEKPFDVKALRDVVDALVPKTQSQRLSKYLNFPKLPEFVDTGPAASKSGKSLSPEPQPPPASRSLPKDSSPEAFKPPLPPSGETRPLKEEATWNMDSFDPIPSLNSDTDDFQELPLKAGSGAAALRETDSELEQDRDLLSTTDSESGDSLETSSPWQRQDLTRFRVGAIDEELEPNDFLRSAAPDNLEGASPKPLSREPLRNEHLLDENLLDEESTRDVVPAQRAADEVLELEIDTDEDHGDRGIVTLARAEEIVREEARKAIEKVVWKMVPEMAAQMVERELKRLLDEHERNSTANPAE